MIEIAILDFVLVLARIGAFVSMFSVFAGTKLPPMVTIGLVVSLSFFWSGSGTPELDAERQVYAASSMGALWLLAVESTIGVVLAVVIGCLLLPARIAGAWLDEVTGLSMAASFNPGLESRGTLAQIFEALSILLYFGTNMHHFFLRALHYSMQMAKPGRIFEGLDFEPTTELFQQSQANGFLMVAPLVICLFLVAIAVAYLNKASPALNMFTVGTGIRIGLGLICLLVFAPVLIANMERFMEYDVEDIESLLSDLFA
jgi:flagellar biosynthesis protein FliR